MTGPVTPKVLRGAFVEYGVSVPPLAVAFQFNPEQLQRTRGATFEAPNRSVSTPRAGDRDDRTPREQPTPLREWHLGRTDLNAIRTGQDVTIAEESLAFELRLDATDALAADDDVATGFGIAPTLATLELMTHPKGAGVLDEALGPFLSKVTGYRFGPSENPPMVLFLWGVRRVLPVNITSMTITETEFDALLNPVRATVSVALTVIEGRNPVYRATHAATEAASLLGSVAAVTDLEIPR